METTNGDSEVPILLNSFRPIPPRIQQTFFGKIRAFNSFTTLEWVYLTTSLIALTVSLGITIERLTVINANESDFTFAVLLLLTTVFCYMYVIHSMFTERFDELMVFVVSNITVLIYCIVNYVTGDTNAIKLLSMLVLVMGKADVILLGETTQTIILASGIPVTFLFILVGFLGLRYENKSLMILFYILALAEPTYITYKFIYIVTTHSNIDAIYNSTFVCGSFALIIWMLLIFSTSYFAIYHFGKGLKERMFEDNGGSQSFTTRNSEATYLLSPSLTGIQST
ncbi:uncharacterized protein [Parasteatoda tepidariorum]|uniref:uncharacterized protein n=1 Tax=Parasteatoda tepidariorum TaxID=114398 RepID=UPI0039BD7E41